MKRKNFARQAQIRRETALARLLDSRYESYDGEQNLEEWQKRKEAEIEILQNKIRLK